MIAIRAPAVAGAFYPGEPQALYRSVTDLLNEAARLDRIGPADPAPKALIAPHAGYRYSGACAAQAYTRLLPGRETIRRIVLLGPSHRVALSGLATTSADVWETPLGRVAIDRGALDRLADLPQVRENDQAHALEHSLEVQLPFLQTLLPRFSLVPLVVGEASPAEVAAVLQRLWGGPETRIVISTDLSHFLDSETARALDDKTAQTIEALDRDGLDREQACGRAPVAGLLAAAGDRGLVVQRLGLCNSGDSAGPRDRVVGYGAWALDESDDAALAAAHGAALLALAEEAIRARLQGQAAPEVDPRGYAASLRYNRATFVTLMREDRLRGCRGSLASRRPLVEDVARNALASAFDDQRFTPLTPEEWDGLSWSIALLGQPRALAAKNLEDLLARLEPGRDGLILQDEGRRATFLPQVWDSLPEPRDLVAQLLAKAGLPRDHWSPSLKIRRYRVTKIGPEP